MSPSVEKQKQPPVRVYRGSGPFESWRTAVQKCVAGRADNPELVVEFLASSAICVLFWEGCCEEDSPDQGRGL